MENKKNGFIKSLITSPTGLTGAIIVILIVFMALTANFIAPHDPNLIDSNLRLMKPSMKPVVEGEAPYYLGTDSMGRDLLSRIIYGSRISLILGLLSALLGGAVGAVLGMLAGYYGKKIDSVISWMTNVQLAFPFTLLAIFIIAVFGGGLVNLIIVLAWGSWVGYARVMRGQVMMLKEKEYTAAAEVLGIRPTKIMWKHIFPNAMSPLIVVMTFTVAVVILEEAALSFLGLGVDPATPTWGSILADGRVYIQKAWWIATLPGIAIFATVLGINLFGDWLRDYFDPRLN